MARIYKKLGDSLKETLVLVISKSGVTVETRNGMLETRNAFKSKNLNFAGQAVAVTGEDSLLAQLAHNEEWLRVFPMWDWVGGRTSVTSAVGLLPAGKSPTAEVTEVLPPTQSHIGKTLNHSSLWAS